MVLHLKLIKRKKFHGEDTKVKEFYDNMSSGQEFVKFLKLIMQLSHVGTPDVFPTIITQYINTKRDIMTQFGSDKSSKAMRKK